MTLIDSSQQLTRELVLLDDDIGDENHDELDKKLLGLRVLRGYVDRNEIPPWEFLLSQIVFHSSGMLDSKYSNELGEPVQRLFIEYPDVKARLEQAWKIKSFKEIRLLREGRSLSSCSALMSLF